MTQKTPILAVPAASVRAGYKIELPVVVDGKEILSRGEVFAWRRVGNNRMEITLLHDKTGSLFVNVVKASSQVGVKLPTEILEPTDALMTVLREHILETVKQNVIAFYENTPITEIAD